VGSGGQIKHNNRSPGVYFFGSASDSLWWRCFKIKKVHQSSEEYHKGFILWWFSTVTFMGQVERESSRIPNYYSRALD